MARLGLECVEFAGVLRDRLESAGKRLQEGELVVQGIIEGPFDCILLPFDLLLGYRIGMVTEEWNQQNPFQAIQARLKQGLSKT